MKLPGIIVSGGCGLRTHLAAQGWRSVVPAVNDERWVALDLSDDTAFDNLPPVEISDDEEQQERESPK